MLSREATCFDPIVVQSTTLRREHANLYTNDVVRKHLNKTNGKYI
jgi:hypothetical protein